jgi:hypothetical protein
VPMLDARRAIHSVLYTRYWRGDHADMVSAYKTGRPRESPSKGNACRSPPESRIGSILESPY